jgi:hypothetical protein
MSKKSDRTKPQLLKDIEAVASMPEIRYIREGEVNKMLKEKDQEIQKLREALIEARHVTSLVLEDKAGKARMTVLKDELDAIINGGGE